MSTTFQKADLRRSLIKLSSTLLGLIAVVGITSLFSIWSMNRAFVSSDIEIAKVRDLAEEGLLAQIDFKVQVQEWKNILLRGNEADLAKLYLTAFETRGASVENHLTTLSGKAKTLGLTEYQTRADALIAKHGKLTSAYRNALKESPDLSPENARRIDRAVRGVDRELESEITLLSQDISSLTKIRQGALIERLSARYKTLRSTLMIVITFFLVITTISLYSVLRGLRD